MKQGGGRSLGFGLAALLPIACCVGVPLIAAAGVSVAAAAWIGGIVVGAIVLVVSLTVLAVRIRAYRRYPLLRKERHPSSSAAVRRREA